MTVNGDLAVVLSGRLGVSTDRAADIIKIVLEAARDPNFAQAFAEKWCGDVGREERDNDMHAYWQVVSFLEDTVS